jgi:hypothetical protein
MPRKTIPLSEIPTEVVDAAVKEAARLDQAEKAKKVQKVSEPAVGVNELAAALVQAINMAKPPEKKNAFTRKANTPWHPKDGSPKIKLRRKFYQHGLLIDPDMETNETIALMNKVRPGTYCDGWVVVKRRRDKGIDIDYSVKTAAHRLKLVNQFGIRSFNELLERCIKEAENPTAYRTAETDDYE